MMTRQCRQHIIKPRRIAQCNHMAAAVRIDRVACPITHLPTSALDNRDECGKIMQFQAGFDHQIDMAGRDKAVIIAIPAKNHAAVRGFGGQPHEMFAIMRIEIMRAAAGQGHRIKRSGCAGAYGLAVERGGLP